MSKKLYASKRLDMKNVIECIPELEALAKVRGKKREIFISKAKNCIINAVSELAKNCLHGNINLNECQFDKLKKYQNILRKINTKKTSIKKRRELMIQNGGFLPLLIPPALSVIAGLVGNELSKIIRK